MSETLPMRLAVGDEVRVHFHPPGPWKSFSEGVVRRVNVTTLDGCFFVLEVRNEILLDQPHRIRPKFHDYVAYRCRDDFPGRIEVLVTADQDVVREPAVAAISVKTSDGSLQGADEPPRLELEVHSEPEVEPASAAEADNEPAQGYVEPQPVRKHSGLLSALFGRREQ